MFSAFYVALGLAFGCPDLFLTRRPEDGSAYLAGYLAGIDLFVDNVFVFALILRRFAVPCVQHRVLSTQILDTRSSSGRASSHRQRDHREGFHWQLSVRRCSCTGYRCRRQRNERAMTRDGTRSSASSAGSSRPPMTIAGSGSSSTNMAVNWRRRCWPSSSSWNERYPVRDRLRTGDLSRDHRCLPGLKLQCVRDPRPAPVPTLAGAVDRFRYLKQGLQTLLIFAGVKIPVADLVPIPIPLYRLAIVLGAIFDTRSARPSRPTTAWIGGRG